MSIKSVGVLLLMLGYIGGANAEWDKPYKSFSSGYSWWSERGSNNTETINSLLIEAEDIKGNYFEKTELAIDSVEGVDVKSTVVHKFVVQLNSGGDDYHLISLKQIFKSLDVVGEENVKFEVVAYGGGLVALLEDNETMFPWVMKLVDRGVEFKACQMTMLSMGLESDDFPLEIDFVGSGAATVIKKRMDGYKGWTP